MEDYKEWSSLKKGDRVTDFFRQKTGVIISDVGVGYTVEWKDGTKERITNGMLYKK
jgi:ribosomal protein L21E